MVEFYDPITKINISYALDKKLQKMWDKLKDKGLEKLNEDRVYLCDGREGTGKSTFVFQQAKYINPNFDINDICFKPNDFVNKIRTAPKGSVIVFDEAFRGLSSKSTRSKTNKAIVEAMMEVRQRNLIIFIVLPTIFLLELYAAVFRSEALFHVYKLKQAMASGRKLRAFKIYNYVKKKQLYLRGKQKYFSYAYPKIKRAKGKFHARMTDEWEAGIPYETFNMRAYLAKKEEAFKNGIGNEEEKEESKYLLQRDLIIQGLYKVGKDKEYPEFKSQKKISDWLEEIKVGLSQQSIAQLLGKLRENEENNNPPPTNT